MESVLFFDSLKGSFFARTDTTGQKDDFGEPDFDSADGLVEVSTYLFETSFFRSFRVDVNDLKLG